ncbi:4-(cytidine 5'-diphospho)-2-C-methyl-D-erythritol kinase [Malaciobacter halophilus]|nr:4-(cytidine 5'-diphospho)-2-C-methyl-D-erythritol kinase [Malaciobacter halophilus]RYA24067.1 4-(cytidine 5'-diphospho)-2-C-methyl-D-erythritol kinase [Malaciobacter halophilus]
MQVSIKSYAKVNIFLKISQKRENYHEIVSRFVRVKNLYDTISFIPNNETNEFNLIGDFGCKLEDNTIYKAFLQLRKYCPKIDAFFRVYSIKVEKNIPEFAGLGGGSSNVAAFLTLANKHFNLYYKKEKLAKIGAKIGADVPFFVYEYDSANVTGIGEIVQEFKEEPLNIEVITPKDIKCHTGKVFTCFRNEFYKQISKDKSNELLSMKSSEILNKLSLENANDLYLPAVKLYPKLKEYAKQDCFFSGSGSSFFKVI